MGVKFRYEKEKSTLVDIIYRPKAEITLKTVAGETKVDMYIDSGADITLIPRSFGEALGFELKKSDIKELRGVGEGSVPVIVENVRMKIGNHEFPARIGWALIEEVPPLLGRMDVFDKFRITFDCMESTTFHQLENFSL